MKLMTKELENLFEKQGDTDGQKNPTAIVKYFHPLSSWYWFGIEYNPATGIFFGLVFGFEAELGSFSLQEFEELKISGLPMERDLWFSPTPIAEVIKEYSKRTGLHCYAYAEST